MTADTLPGMMVGGRPRDNHQLRKHINQRPFDVSVDVTTSQGMSYSPLPTVLLMVPGERLWT